MLLSNNFILDHEEILLVLCALHLVASLHFKISSFGVCEILESFL